MNFQNRNSTNQQIQRPSETMLYLVPQHVSAVENYVNETFAQVIGRQEKFIRLKKNIRYKLASYDTGQKIQSIGQKYQFELLRLANITRLIREYYFGEVRFENFPTEIEKRMGVSLLTAQEITRYIKSEIIDWDPWDEYLAKLPKLPIREVAQKYPKMTNTEITKKYIKLKNSDDLENPTIKNWLKDYISHLGYDHHSQMQRTEYLFHSENGRGLDSQDREKLGIIVKSFDENIPLPMDEETGEIVFDGMISESQPKTDQPMAGTSKFAVNTQVSRPQQIPQTTNNFIKPYAPISQPKKPTSSQPFPPRFQSTSFQFSPIHTSGQTQKREEVRPNPAPIRTGPTQNFVIPNPVYRTQSIKDIPTNFASQTGKEDINKYFSAPESSEIPEIKIHSITEHNEPPARNTAWRDSDSGKKIAPLIAPRPIVQQPLPPRPPIGEARQISVSPQPEQASRPKYKIIDPFFSKPRPEPRLDGNIVDLSKQ